MKKIMLILILGLMILPLVSADIIFETIDETSGLSFDNSVDVELRNATVDINIYEHYGDLESYFYVYSNEQTEKEVRVYLKAKGEDCYRGTCEDNDLAVHAFNFEVNGESIYDAYEYETSEGKFAAVNFTLLPNQINIIKIQVYEIKLPFNYYLDSLSTFQKADYEKITINGTGLEVEFNEHYPVNKISDNEFVWEYSNIDVNDPNIRDVLVITKTGEPGPIPEPGFFSKIWNWFKGWFS
jgi:hypothetical protein